MSFYKPLCINNIPEINDTLILFREKKHLCARKKRKEENGDDIKEKKQQWGYYSIAAFLFIIAQS